MEKRPAAQLTQGVEGSASSSCWPAAQLTQSALVVDPGGAKLPGSQLPAHTVAPTASEYLPASHDTHGVLARPPATVSTAASWSQRPGLHGSQAAALVCPGAPYVPASAHTPEHCVAPTTPEKRPAVQFSHAVLERLSWSYWPGAHIEQLSRAIVVESTAPA